MIKVAILTVSDSCARGDRQDVSGKVIEDLLKNNGFHVTEKTIVPDELDAITDRLLYLADRTDTDVVLTTGGTGLGPRDVTPEATESVCEKLVPGLAEIIRMQGYNKTKRAVLSRAVVGIRNQTLIVNLPGSAKGTQQSLELIIELLPHALDMIHGKSH